MIFLKKSVLWIKEKHQKDKRRKMELGKWRGLEDVGLNKKKSSCKIVETFVDIGDDNIQGML